ncbi:MAG: PIG-L deacetylase family protein [Candidatus Daviesbacteria bacterium]|nr:PIG-L deacetylase family protein [Candidatus Daviesbacteria bacterium]
MISKKSLLKSKLNLNTSKIILAVGAHPDDIDIISAGTIAKWVKEGATAYYLVLTDGSKGSEDLTISKEDLIKLRRKEQQQAADVLGVKKVFFLNYEDGELSNTPALRKDIVKIIRQIKPTTVICPDPTFYYDESRMMVNHPDHRITGEITVDAVYPFARNARTFPELLDECLEPHVVEELLLVNFSKANYFVDIENTIEQKIKALSFYQSQFRDIKKFGEMIKQMNQMAGEKAKPKLKFAEGFVRITLRKPV